MNDTMSIGQLIYQTRRQRGIPQYILAGLIGISTRTLQRIEKDEYIPSDDLALMLAQNLRLNAWKVIQLCEKTRGIYYFTIALSESNL